VFVFLVIGGRELNSVRHLWRQSTLHNVGQAQAMPPRQCGAPRAGAAAWARCSGAGRPGPEPAEKVLDDQGRSSAAVLPDDKLRIMNWRCTEHRVGSRAAYWRRVGLPYLLRPAAGFWPMQRLALILMYASVLHRNCRQRSHDGCSMSPSNTRSSSRRGFECSFGNDRGRPLAGAACAAGAHV